MNNKTQKKTIMIRRNFCFSYEKIYKLIVIVGTYMFLPDTSCKVGVLYQDESK